MAKKLKKAKTGMSPRTKSIISNSFRGIISNQACVDNGREAPWWLAIIFFLFAVIIPLVPNHVAMNKTYGASFLNNGTYDFAEQVTKASIFLKQDALRYADGQAGAHDKQLVVNGSTLYYKEDGVILTENDQTREFYSNVSTITGEYDFRMIYTTCEGSTFDDVCNIYKLRRYYSNTTTEVDWTDWNAKPASERETYYVPNLMIFGRYTMRLFLFEKSQKGTGTSTLKNGTSYGLTWEKISDGDILSASVYNLKNWQTIDVNHINLQQDTVVYDYYKELFNNCYVAEKNRMKWNTTLIYLGVYGGLMIFLGLMVFLLTRGQKNPYSSLNLWHAEKIAAFLGFTPALLAMIFGFIFGGNMLGQMAFIMLLSLRVMWASMRTLRPVA